ncbi:unnamed protein product [Cylindrotheca closterium]|uniref:Endonuclease/exonuclease/phosphatase domain-containing protein n=1 Tax=Cylindrotheca closterium TaxID=2856 RepID=A0AAD2CUT7_9STRA|nr:unnamed protein product [Cylindrotheca closterium]
MSQLLVQCFEITGTHADVFRSLLQVSDPVRIGLLLNYPMGIGRAALERELMRHFTFKRAIALEPAWPQNPAFDRSAWLAAMDAELNQGPAGLFQMILPGPIDGFYVFVVRQKFASLAQEVLKNLAAFLISHLELWQDLKYQRKTCRTWLCLDHYNRTIARLEGRPLPLPTPALKSTPQSATNPPTESPARAKLSASEQRSRHARLRSLTVGRGQNLRNQHTSSQVAHSLLDAYLNSLPPGNYFSDDSHQKSPRVTRYLFQNVQGLPFPMTHEKQKGHFKRWTDERVGIALLAEVNLQWSAVPIGHKWFDRVKTFTYQGHFSSVSYYKHQEIPTPSAHQWGGCSATLLHKVVRHAKSGGKDESGLGRFSWIKIWGRDIRQQESQTDGPPAGPLDLVVVSAYRPNKEGTNAGCVWNYQQNHWLSKGVTMDPRDKLTLDLVDLIKQWKAEGCKILLGLDANEDVSYNSPSSFRQEMRSEGLTEAILRRHQGPYPATTQSRTTDTPIDGIFVTNGVRVTAGGYLDFQQYFKSDHRGLWTLGAPPVTSPSFQPRRLTLADGRSVDRYIKAAEAGYWHFRLPQRLTQLAEDILVRDGYLTANQQAQFNTIHCQAYEICRRAERNCRKLSMDKAKWYLEHQAYKEAKRKRAHQWRLEYLENRSAAVRRAKKGNIKARIRLKSSGWHKKEETRWRRKAQGKGFSGGLQQIKVTQVAQDGTSHWVTCQSKRLVEEGCMQENRLRCDQTRYPYPTPPMTAHLYSNFNGPNAKRNSQALLRGLYETADPYLVSFLDHCRRAEGLEDQPLEVDLEDHVSFWQTRQDSGGPHAHNPNDEFRAAGQQQESGEIGHCLCRAAQLDPKRTTWAIDLALTKRLTWDDLLHLQRRPAGWISNDATSCFDQIVHWVAIISLMRFGIQWRTLRSMFDTLMKSKQRVRTGFGNSDRVFTPPTLIPFQGYGQGNGARPPIWVAISSIRLGMMIRKGFGFDFLMSISWALLLADCFCFVDDTDICPAALPT